MGYDHWGRLVSQRAKQFGNRSVLKYKSESGKWEGISWNEFEARVETAACALVDFGVKVNDKVAIFSQNMVEWIIADMAIARVRAVSVPVYATNTTEQLSYIIQEAEVDLLFAGQDEQYEKSLPLLDQPGGLKTLVVFDPKVSFKEGTSSLYFSDFLEKGKSSSSLAEVKKRQAEASGEDLATLIYTSGTTGEPKGVMLTHANLIETLRTHDMRMDLKEGETSLAFLPFSHIFERGWVYMCLHKGMVVYVNTNPREVQNAIREVRPNYMCSVPRFWEKVYAALTEKLENKKSFQGRLFHWTHKIGRRYNLHYKRLEKRPPFLLWLMYKLASKLVLKKIYYAVGIENGKFFPTAGAPLSDEINEFLHSLGINIRYGYGLTETTASVSFFDLSHFRIGTIGKAMPGLQVKIGPQNEILVKGKTVMKGYYKKPKATAECFVDGWFRTGDAGALDEEGNLIMTERIKDLYKTAGGKYVAPQAIEGKLGMDRYIDQVAVIGDQKKYVTALISPAMDSLKEYARSKNIPFSSVEELVKHYKIIEFFEQRINLLQKELARFEQVKKFTLLPKAFSMEKGELTSTLKLRRKVILERYKDVIDKMY